MIEAQTVHILHYGVTLCKFMNGAAPKDWPARHVWVSILYEHLCTCSQCKELVPRVAPVHAARQLTRAELIEAAKETEALNEEA
jgi:hypothetical protein